MNFIRIQNKKYPVRFLSGGFLRFKQLAGHDVNQMQEEITEQIILLYAFTSATCRADAVPFDMDLETFADSLDLGDLLAFTQSFAAEFQKKTAQAIAKMKTAKP